MRHSPRVQWGHSNSLRHAAPRSASPEGTFIRFGGEDQTSSACEADVLRKYFPNESEGLNTGERRLLSAHSRYISGNCYGQECPRAVLEALETKNRQPFRAVST
jgi:hypothetical protein